MELIDSEIQKVEWILENTKNLRVCERESLERYLEDRKTENNSLKRICLSQNIKWFPGKRRNNGKINKS